MHTATCHLPQPAFIPGFMAMHPPRRLWPTPAEMLAGRPAPAAVASKPTAC